VYGSDVRQYGEHPDKTWMRLSGRPRYTGLQQRLQLSEKNSFHCECTKSSNDHRSLLLIDAGISFQPAGPKVQNDRWPNAKPIFGATLYILPFYNKTGASGLSDAHSHNQ